MHKIPKIISYDDLLRVFFNSHDPTTLNQQGPDKGTQYRSVIFYASNEEKEKAKAYIQKLLTAKNFDITNSFEENKGYIFITTRNCCLAHHKTKKKDYNVVNADWIFETISNEGDKYYDNTNEYYMNKVNQILETDKAFNETEKSPA